jgi:hypothetical protein
VPKYFGNLLKGEGMRRWLAALTAIAVGVLMAVAFVQMKFTFPGDQHITSVWNGAASQSGENVTITNASYNGTIAPGGNTSAGFQGTWTNSDAVPTSFAVNGVTCT